MLNLTPRVWDARLLPTKLGLAPSAGWKHGRPIECYDPTSPNHGWIYNFGGDWDDTAGQSSSQQEVYRYNPEFDANLGDGQGWQKVVQYCGVEGSAYPGGPDQVCVAHDTKRKRFWVLPGYMPGQPPNLIAERRLAQPLAENGNETEVFSQTGLQAFIDNNYTSRAIAIINDDLTWEWIRYTGVDTTNNSLTGCTRGGAGTPRGAHPVGRIFTITGTPPCGVSIVRAAIPWTPFWFDYNTHEWHIAGHFQSIPVGEGTSNGFYDETTDSIYRIRGVLPQTRIERIQLPSLTVTSRVVNLGTGNITIGHNDIAYNIEDRIAYVLVPGASPHMIRYDVANDLITVEGGSSTPPRSTVVFDSAGIDCFYPKWNPFDKVLMWGFVSNFSTGTQNPNAGGRADIAPLYVYHPEAGFGYPAKTWEPITTDVNDTVTNPQGYMMGGNSHVFSRAHNCLIYMGRSAGPSPTDGGVPSRVYLFRYAAVAPAFRPIGVTATLGG